MNDYPADSSDCPQCSYPMSPRCDNPACPHDKTGKQLAAIREAEEAWLRQQALETYWRIAYNKTYHVG
jgi:hypothetical protein